MEMVFDELAGPVTRVKLAGRLDAAGAEQIGLRFTAATAGHGRDSVVDLSGVSFVASMGLRLLIGASRALASKGHKLVLYGAQPLVQGVLDDAAIGQVIPVVGGEAQALGALAA